MSIYTTRSKSFNLLRKELENSDVILDIGCGIRPQTYLQSAIHICVDPHQEYLDYVMDNIDPNTHEVIVPLKLTWHDVVNALPKNSVDSIFLLDVVEHINKKEAKSLIKKSQEIARKQIVIFTPLNFIEQFHSDEKDAWGLHGGKWQNHLSGWSEKDFGKNWKTIVVKKFHTTNNMGEKYQHPKGAIWAIYTKPLIKRTYLKNHDRELNLKLYKKSIDSHLGKLTILFISILMLTRKIVNLFSRIKVQ